MLARMRALLSIAWVLVLTGSASVVRAQDAASEPPAPAPAPAYDDNAPPPPPPPAPPPNDGAYGGRGQAQAHDARGSDNNDNDNDYEPQAESGGDSAPREYSIRVDPFNWLLDGRLGIELEAGVWKFISVEMIPVFVANTRPWTIHFSGLDDALSQHSNGVGPLSGASLGAGFWLSGTPFNGYVIRAYFTNYGYTYETRDGAGLIDRVSVTERRFVGFFGSHSRFGPFTIAGGFGLGYELNQQERCGLTFATPAGGGAAAIDGPHTGCNGHQQIALDRGLSRGTADLNGPLHPIYLEARFSLGFVF